MDNLLTCPVCLDIEAPTFQCHNGHIVCGPCLDRISVQSERYRVCPTCRVKYGKDRIRCLVADAFIENRNQEQVVATTSGVVRSRSGRRLSPGGGGVVTDAAAADQGAPVRVLRRAERVSRVYQIVADGNTVEVRSGPSLSSESRNRTLSFGTYVQIVETMTIEVGDETGKPKHNRQKQQRRGLVRGRLDTGEGWISLSESGTAGRTFAVQLELGSYCITAPSVAVTSSLNLDSERLAGEDGTIRFEECVDIVALRYLPSRGDRVRGKLTTGGWITIIDAQNARTLAKPFRRGVYCTIAKYTEITSGVRRETVGKTRLEAGRCLQIANTVYSPQDGCVRGKLLSGAGWVSLLDKTDWKIHVQFLPLGAYQIQHSRGKTLAVYQSPKGIASTSDGQPCPSGKTKPIPAGSYIEIIETSYVDKDSMVRGRLQSGGWVSLLDTASGIVYATPVPIGVYITTFDSIAIDVRAEGSPRRRSTGAGQGGGGDNVALPTSSSPATSPSPERKAKARVLPRYSTIEVTECHFLKSSKCVRARLASGGWVTLINSTGGRAKPIMVGTYITTRDYSIVHKGVRVDKSAEVMRIPAERVVDVVETRYVERDGCIRGRLASGGWISLVSTTDNQRYCKKMEERKRKSVASGPRRGGANSGTSMPAANSGRSSQRRQSL